MEGSDGYYYIGAGLSFCGKMWSFPTSPAFCYNDTIDLEESKDFLVNGSLTVQWVLPVTSVLLWRGWPSVKSNLMFVHENVTANLYINNCLRPQHVPFIQQTIAMYHFCCILTRNFLMQRNITVLQWPAMSPGLNLIEHNLYDRIDRIIRNQMQQSRTPQHLEEALLHASNWVHQMDIRRPCLTMRRRCNAVINAARGHSSY